MSLFDVIKYPISDPPALKELRVLPESIIDNIFSSEFGEGGNYPNGVKCYHIWVCTNSNGKDYMCARIKELLREHDEPI